MKPKVLFVDDEKNILNTLKTELRGCDFEPFVAYSGEEALRILENDKFPVVISDMRMPEMNGVELLTKIKELYPDTIRMILSGYSDIDLILDSINNGKIYRYITKPWNVEDLKIIITQALEYYHILEDRDLLLKKLAERNKELKALNNNLEKIVEERTHELIVKDKILHYLLGIHPLDKSLDFILQKFYEVMNQKQIVFLKSEKDQSFFTYKSMLFKNNHIIDNTKEVSQILKETGLNKYYRMFLNKIVTSNNANEEIRILFKKADIENFIIVPVQNNHTKFGALVSSFNDEIYINKDMINKKKSFIRYLAIALNDNSFIENFDELGKNIGDLLGDL